MRVNTSNEPHDIVAVEVDPEALTVQHTTVFESLDQMEKHYRHQLDPDGTKAVLAHFHRVPDYGAVELPAVEEGFPMLLIFRGKKGREFEGAIQKAIDWRRRHPTLNNGDLAEYLNQRIQATIERFCDKFDIPDTLLMKGVVYDVLSELRNGSLEENIPGCCLVPLVDSDQITLAKRASVRSYEKTSHLRFRLHDLLNDLTLFLQDDIIDIEEERAYKDGK